MQVVVNNCKQKDVVKLLRKATHYYARLLFTKGGHKGLKVKIILINDTSETYEKEPDMACSYVTHYGENYKPTNFTIEILKTDLRSVFHALAHEMVHVKQFASRTISSNLDSWKGKKLRGNIPYWDEPWEIEAYGREVGLFQQFIEEYELNDFFIKNSRWKQQKEIYDY